MVRLKQDQPENPLVRLVSCIGERLVRTLQDGISLQLAQLLGLRHHEECRRSCAN